MTTLLTARIESSQSGTDRRRCEQQAEAALVERAFGPAASLSHYEDGAPFIEGRPDLFISLSHSATTCVLAVSTEPVGVDIETPRTQLLRVKCRFMTPEEMSRVEWADDGIVDHLLYYWTAKEAVYKLLRVPGLALTEIELSPSLDLAAARGCRCVLTFSRYENELIAVAERATESHS